MATVYKFHADMSCSSCSNRIKKVLEKNRSKGISAFEVDLEKKLVTVTGTITKQEITEILAKTGINIDLLEERPQE